MQVRQGTYYRDADILLAEPDEEHRRWTSSVLRRLGCRVTVVSDSPQAVSMVRARRFDAVVMAAELPALNGHPPSRAIRKLADRTERSTPPIVGLVHPMDETRFRLMDDAGMDAWLPKPVDYDRANAVLSDLLCHAPRDAEEEEEEDRPVTPTELGLIAGRLDELVEMGGSDLVQDLVRIFPEENGPLLEEMEAAHAAQDDAMLARLAHRLKSSASNLGMHQLTNVCRSIESLARDRALETPREIMTDLRHAYERSLKRLATALGELKPA